MRNLTVIIVIIVSLFTRTVDNLRINFDPNVLRLSKSSEELNDLLEILLRTENYELLRQILKTEASDFVPIYCNTWKTYSNSDLIFHIWDGYFSGKIDEETLNELMLPECLAKSYFTIINLTKQIIKAFPRSILQVADFPYQLLMPSILETILKQAIQAKTRDPKVKWSSWIMSDGLDFKRCPVSAVFSAFGWQMISPSEFLALSEQKSNCLINWLLMERETDFMKLSDVEILMRTLTLISWKTFKSTSALYSILRRVNYKSNSSTSQSLTRIFLNIGGPNDPEWTLDILKETISVLECFEGALIGDWFIGILNLWKNALKSITLPSDIYRILQFALFTLEPTYLGASKLPELFDPSMRAAVESIVYERFKNDIKSFYREYPTFFQVNFAMIPLKIRLNTLLRRHRSFGPVRQASELDMKVFWDIGVKEFLLFLGDKLRRGVDDLGPNYFVPLRFGGKALSFKILTELFLLSFRNMPEWFKVIKNVNGKDHIIPMPVVPDLFWELLGYFLVQARISNVNLDFVIERKFFLETMKPVAAREFLRTLSETFFKTKINNLRILSMNMMNRFTVSSVIPYEDYHPFDDSWIDCRSLVYQLFRKGMKSMQNGMLKLLDPVNLTPEELYIIIFNE